MRKANRIKNETSVSKKIRENADFFFGGNLLSVRGYGALLAFIPEDNLVITVNANDASINRDEMLRDLTSLSW